MLRQNVLFSSAFTTIKRMNYMGMAEDIKKISSYIDELAVLSDKLREIDLHAVKILTSLEYRGFNSLPAYRETVDKYYNCRKSLLDSSKLLVQFSDFLRETIYFLTDLRDPHPDEYSSDKENIRLD